MIFYFSATGNSLYAAKKIASAIGGSVINIAREISGPKAYAPEDGEPVGFVFPLYAWLAPAMVFDFISAFTLNHAGNHYAFAVATYGQNIGRFDRPLGQALAAGGLRLDAAFSLNMPNNYISVWPKEQQDRCLAAADQRLARITEAIASRRRTIDIQSVLNGRQVPDAAVAFAPAMHAQWSRTIRDVSDFYVTDACVGCGLCAKVCNGQTIRIIDGRPTWGNSCTKCLACLHLCPRQAIQFGPYTGNAGRYKNPNISVQELIVAKEDTHHEEV